MVQGRRRRRRRMVGGVKREGNGSGGHFAFDVNQWLGRREPWAHRIGTPLVSVGV